MLRYNVVGIMRQRIFLYRNFYTRCFYKNIIEIFFSQYCCCIRIARQKLNYIVKNMNIKI